MFGAIINNHHGGEEMEGVINRVVYLKAIGLFHFEHQFCFILKLLILISILFDTKSLR